ncbi:MAG: lytic transglycosylase domain-containing protein [Candidatus Sulfobium sp.]|jgi:soluble lytic murein transglycosylase-like protein
MLRFFMLKIAFSVFFMLMMVSPAFPVVYKYVDANGVVCYTDAPMTQKSELVSKDAPVRRDVKVRQASYSVNHDYSEYVSRVASKYDLEPGLIRAVIRTESNGDRTAVSKKGAIGLMQIMPATADDMNVGNPFDPKENIEGGTKYLKYLLERFDGDLTLALAAYNAGPATVEKYGGMPPIQETRQYVKKVLSLYNGSGSASSGFGRKTKSAPMHIYKVVLADGTTLFTNSSLARADRTRF